MKNIKGFSDEKVEFSRKRIDIAREFHFTIKSDKEIGLEFGCTHKTVWRCGKDYSRDFFMAIRDKKETFLMFDLKDIPKITRVLQQLNLNYRYPTKEHSLEESYESSLNGQTLTD